MYSVTAVKIFEKFLWKSWFFSKAAGCSSVGLGMNFFTGVFQEFGPQVLNSFITE